MTFERGFKTRANKIAIQVREKMGLLPIDPIDPVKMCEKFEITLIELSKLNGVGRKFLGLARDQFSAVTVPVGVTTAIVHNDSHHPHRQRSNICHELAHCFLGHQCVPPLTDDGFRAHDGGIEAEANFLAGTLLLTNEAALHVITSGLAEPVAQTIYGISLSMLQYRLRVSGANTIHQRRVVARRKN